MRFPGIYGASHLAVLEVRSASNELRAQRRATSNGSTFAPPVMREFEGSKCSRSSDKRARIETRILQAYDLPERDVHLPAGRLDEARETTSSSRRLYCRRTGRLRGPRKPKPCQRTLAGSGKLMWGKRSNSMGSRIAPTVRRERCAPAQ